MKVYPFARDNEVVEQIALRLTGSDSPWNQRTDRLELVPPENGEPIHLDARIDVDVPTVIDRPLLPTGLPATLLAVARCRDTRWSEVVQTWQVPLDKKKRFTPDPATIAIDSNRVAGQFRLVFCLCLANERAVKADMFARKRWNILAEKRFTVVMAGSGGSVTEWVSFSERKLPAGLWHLNLPGGELDQPLSNLRLYLNKDHESFRRLLATTSGNQRDRLLAHTFVRRLIRTAFIQGVLSLALTCPKDDLPDDVDAIPGTCWELAFNLCRQVFHAEWVSDEPFDSLKEIQKAFGTKTNLIETRVQEIAELPQVLERSLILNPPGVA